MMWVVLIDHWQAAAIQDDSLRLHTVLVHPFSASFGLIRCIQPPRRLSDDQAACCR